MKKRSRSNTVVVAESLCVRETDVRDSKLGVETVYTGESSVLLSGISSRTTPTGSTFKLLNGTKVRVCTRPVISFDGTSNPPRKVRVHYQVQVDGHGSDCSCGNCNRTFTLTGCCPSKCGCGTEEYDEGKQPCIVM